MNTKEFVQVLRKIIKEEVKSAVKEALRDVSTDNLIESVVSAPKPEYNYKPKKQPIAKQFVKDPLLNSLLKIAGLEKRNITGSGLKETIKNLKDRLNIIEGEIEAGNNNILLKDELYNVLFKLVHFNVISEIQARKHFKNIVSEYFKG